jgi:hypothetical protein
MLYYIFYIYHINAVGHEDNTLSFI